MGPSEKLRYSQRPGCMMNEPDPLAEKQRNFGGVLRHHIVCIQLIDPIRLGELQDIHDSFIRNDIFTRKPNMFEYNP